MALELTDLHWQALALAENLPGSASAISRVAAQTSPEAARWAFTQWNLRRKAKDKTPFASDMLFVTEALEQATRQSVSAYHASLFPEGARVADISAGIGLDAMELLRRGPVVAYEVDPERATYLRWNLGLIGPGFEVREQDCLVGKWDCGHVFADPARRVGGKRTLDPSLFSPNPLALAERMKELDLGLLKMSPMLRDETLHELSDDCLFVSQGGECREALLVFGRSTGVRAVHIETGLEFIQSEEPPRTDEVLPTFYEADPAVIRASAIGSIPGDFYQLGDYPGYLTAPTPVHSPVLTGYRTLAVGAFDRKHLLATLKGQDARVVALKQRGAGLNLEELIKTMPTQGHQPVSVAFWKVGRSVRYAILTSLPSEGGP